MRPIWTGTISFGLLQVPVQLFSATRDLGVHFRMLDGRDKKPVRYQRINSETGDEVPWKDIVKAFEVKKGNFLVMDEKELKKAAPEQTETIELEAFVDRCDVHPNYFEKPYYVAPAKKAGKSYALLHQALLASEKMGIARIVIRTRQYLAALHPEKDALMLMLTLMRFAQEVIEPKAAGVVEPASAKKNVRPAELEMAKKLLESMSKKWRPADYKDDFRPRFRALLEKRAKRGGTVHEEKAAPPAEEKEGKVIDLVALLQRSLPSGKTASSRPGARRAKKPATPRRRKAS